MSPVNEHSHGVEQQTHNGGPKVRRTKFRKHPTRANKAIGIRGRVRPPTINLSRLHQTRINGAKRQLRPQSRQPVQHRPYRARGHQTIRLLRTSTRGRTAIQRHGSLTTTAQSLDLNQAERTIRLRKAIRTSVEARCHSTQIKRTVSTLINTLGSRSSVHRSHHINPRHHANSQSHALQRRTRKTHVNPSLNQCRANRDSRRRKKSRKGQNRVQRHSLNKLVSGPISQFA